MSNEQLMQNELAKAITGVDEVATDELSDEELKSVAGGIVRPTICIRSRVTPRPRPYCVRRSRRHDGSDLE